MAEGDKILVTGGAGYLGSVMVPLFLHLGHRVTVLDNFMYTQTGLAGVCHHPRFDVVEGDARVQETVKPLLKDADIIIPLAALVGAPICDKHPEDATSTNLDAVRMLVGMLARILKPPEPFPAARTSAPRTVTARSWSPSLSRSTSSAARELSSQLAPETAELSAAVPSGFRRKRRLGRPPSWQT